MSIARSRGAWLCSTTRHEAPSSMGSLRKNWFWIIAPIVLFGVIVVALSFMDQGPQGYPIR